MPRTGKKVDELAEEGEQMTDALSTVLGVADEKGVVTWGDVSDDISSGEWGRLIEKGLLVDVDGEGFVVDDPEGVRDALDEADPDSDDDGGGVWTVYDKMALLGIVGLFVGYAFSGVRASIAGLLDVFLGPLETAMPFYMVILVLATVTGVFSAIIQDNLMDTSVMSEYKEKADDLKERREQAKERGDEEELERIQEEQVEMMTENLGMLQAQFRPMIWIMLSTIPVFLWMFWLVRDLGVTVQESVLVMPFFGAVPSWSTGVLGPIEVWIVWYFMCSLVFTQVIRKSLDVRSSPSG
jgi:uncharacterized membrane protein (DUF106 family)